MNDLEMQAFLEGDILYGDNFTDDEICQWFTQEEEGYANLGSKDVKNYEYEYHALNRQLGYDFLPDSVCLFENVLGFGSAYGDELLPIISRIKNITIIDPSNAFISNSVHGVPTSYVKPNPNGALPFEENTFDLITCFGALHHIPNVSTIINELNRVLKPNAHLLLREPIVSMGDWRYPRPGLTNNERGIPLQMLKKIVVNSGFIPIHTSLSGFPLTERLFRIIRKDFYNSSIATYCDAKVSEAFAWNVNYHPKNLLQKFRPTSVFFVLKKIDTSQN
jgi:SAM-dependent methyltransferase